MIYRIHVPVFEDQSWLRDWGGRVVGRRVDFVPRSVSRVESFWDTGEDVGGGQGKESNLVKGFRRYPSTVRPQLLRDPNRHRKGTNRRGFSFLRRQTNLNGIQCPHTLEERESLSTFVGIYTN